METKITQGMVWPPGDGNTRNATYQQYTLLLKGDHFTAFNAEIKDPRWTKKYQRLRYMTINLPGMVSRICADMLFSEPIVVNAKDDQQQPFLDALIINQKLHTKLYESAVDNSAKGDAVFKIRTNGGASTEPIVIETIDPSMHYMLVNPNNSQEVTAHVISWEFTKDKKNYVRMEIHLKGAIENKICLLDRGLIADEQPLDGFTDEFGELKPRQETGIDEFLIVHVPNFKLPGMIEGISDYEDIITLVYGINNRMTAIDNILDKHSDPILAMPEGYLDENGELHKKFAGVIEYENGTDGKPEYIVWDASLDNAFRHLEKMIEMFYMVAEVSPDVLGLGKGVSDSGRALKFKIMRTLAKTQRKKLHYMSAIKKILLISEKLAAKFKDLKPQGVAFTGTPEEPEVIFADGLPNNYDEQVITEAAAIDAQLTSKKQSIKRLYGLDDEAADDLLTEIEEEQPKIELPEPKLTSSIDNPDENTRAAPVK